MKSQTEDKLSICKTYNLPSTHGPILFIYFFGIFNHILIPVKPKIKVPQIPVSSWETVKCRVNLSLGAEHFLGRYWDKTLDGCQSSLTSNLNDLKRPQIHKIHGGVSLNQQTPFLFQIFICPEKTKKNTPNFEMCFTFIKSWKKKQMSYMQIKMVYTQCF